MSKLNPRKAAAARDVALDVLFRVFTQGAFASAALRSAFDARPMNPADRGLATEIVYGVLRRRAFVDRSLSAIADKRTKDFDPRLLDVLRIGAYQLLYLDRVPDHAVVQEAVEQAKKRRGPRGAGFVNAVLRKMARTPADRRMPEPPDRKKDPIGFIAVVGGLPRSIATRLAEDLGHDEAIAFAKASLEPAFLSLRANTLVATPEEIAEEVGGELTEVPGAVRLRKQGVLPADLPCVRDGRATPQDEASMRVVQLLDPQLGDSVLDVCAAPGGKTTHIAELMKDNGRVVAHDRHPNRLRRVAHSAERLKLDAITTVPVLPPEDEPFDRVLVDAPCSGLGTLRRHPEIRWRLTEADVAALAETQHEVLLAGAARVKPGGVLVYSVCTVTRAEGDAQIEALGDRFDVDAILRTGPHQAGAPDGFFAARLIRR